MNLTVIEENIVGRMLQNLLVWEYYIGIVLFIPTGTLGNIVSMGVFARKAFRKTGMGKYLIAQSACGLVFQIFSINQFVSHIFNQLACQITWVINLACMVFDGLIKTTVSVDRMILVKFPTRFRFIKKAWFQLAVIMTLGLLCLAPAIAIQMHIDYDFVINDVRQCYVSPDYVSHTAITVSRTVNLYIGHVMPFFVMLACAIVMLKKLREMKKKSNKSGGKRSEHMLMVYTIFSIGLFLILSGVYMAVLFYQAFFFNFNTFEINMFTTLLGTFFKNAEMNSSFFTFLFFNKLFRIELNAMCKSVIHAVTRGRFGTK